MQFNAVGFRSYDEVPTDVQFVLAVGESMMRHTRYYKIIANKYIVPVSVFIRAHAQMAMAIQIYSPSERQI